MFLLPLLENCSSSSPPDSSSGWQQVILFENGTWAEAGCAAAPATCALVASTGIPAAARWQVKFSALRPGRRVLPHTGPTNTRVRAHLGLKVPQVSQESHQTSQSRLRIADVVTGWTEGEYLVIDDSFEHEVSLDLGVGVSG